MSSESLLQGDKVAEAEDLAFGRFSALRAAGFLGQHSSHTHSVGGSPNTGWSQVKMWLLVSLGLHE